MRILQHEKYLVPLKYDPGTSWAYGVGIDWAGQMVERVTNMSLGSYMAENIWNPLGLTSTTFRLQSRPDILNRRADMTVRTSSGALAPSPTRFFTDNAPDDHGGGGLFSCAEDYVKLLVSVLKNDGTLLKPSSIDLLFTPYLSPAAAAAFRDNRTAAYTAYRNGPAGSKVERGATQPIEMNYALGGQLSEKDWIGGRKAGSMSWGGLPNLSWVIDRTSGIALLYCSQILPPGDHVSRAAFERFEGAVYRGEFGDL